MPEREQQIEQLIGLGLNRYEAAVYLALLGRQGFTPAQAAVHSGVPRQRIYDVLASLNARGLCFERHSEGQRLFFPIDPASAFAALIEQRRRQFMVEEQRMQAQADTLSTALGPLFAAGNDLDDPLEYIDVILDRRRVSERALGLAAAVEHEICVCFKRPLVGDAETNFQEVQAPLARGLRYRTIYERSLFDDEELLGWVKHFIAWGQQARVVNQLPIKLNLYDNRVALLSLQDPVTSRPSLTALCVTHPSFTNMLSLAFESLWQQGEDV
ncbi:MAG: TrmB family transcriptional regulator [Oscillochloris sp.]|nr:TrmB family transcriptional regulator [Oscillochloris sp.]